MFRPALALAALLAFSPVVQAQESGIQIPYVQHDVTDPTVTPMWPDMIAMLSPDAIVTPHIYSADMPTSTGGSFVVSMFKAVFVCGINTCPVRIFEDGKLIAQLNACDEAEGHLLSEDGETFIGCGISQSIADAAVPSE